MAKQLVVTICALVVITSTGASFLEPLDLADEAAKQLAELESIVKGDILAAHDDLSGLATNFEDDAMYIAADGGVDILQEFGTIYEQITTIKNLGNTAGEDVSSCTDDLEEYFLTLPVQYRKALNDCVSEIMQESEILTRDAKYIVDIIINKVSALERQLFSCGGDILCISPLVSQIEVNKIQLPQSIKTEVSAVGNQLTILMLSVRQCSDTNVSAFVADSTSILSDITECINGIIS